mmetsp:Transcript_2021/g.3901  ORF Transcript_2021/g.3901 Transcript_2021/m.3901 type:complete len:370 (-) Transcript_2021:630-1739(-)
MMYAYVSKFLCLLMISLLLLLLCVDAFHFVTTTTTTRTRQQLQRDLVVVLLSRRSDNGGVDSSSMAPLSLSAAAPLRSVTSLPKRKKKRKTPKTNKSNNNKNKGQPMTEQELADHVSSLYIHGPGGVLRPRRTAQHQRQQQQEEEDLQQHEFESSSTRNLDRYPALLLNADYKPMSYLPLSLWNWQEAVKAVFNGKVTVVDVYPGVTIRAANIEVPLPAVIALTEYVPQFQQTPAFTKRNVFLRDEYRCQYCNDLFHTRELSLDHVVPRCKGGGLHWENAVTCCRKCNGAKGSMDLVDIRRQLGMRLLRPPRTPTQYELAATASRMLPRRVHPTWEPFLGTQNKQKQQQQQQQQQQLFIHNNNNHNNQR